MERKKNRRKDRKAGKRLTRDVRKIQRDKRDRWKDRKARGLKRDVRRVGEM